MHVVWHIHIQNQFDHFQPTEYQPKIEENHTAFFPGSLVVHTFLRVETDKFIPAKQNENMDPNQHYENDSPSIYVVKTSTQLHNMMCSKMCTYCVQKSERSSMIITRFEVNIGTMTQNYKRKRKKERKKERQQNENERAERICFHFFSRRISQSAFFVFPNFYIVFDLLCVSANIQEFLTLQWKRSNVDRKVEMIKFDGAK